MGSENAVDDEVTSGIDGGGTVTYDGDAEKELGIVGMAIDIDEEEKELGIVGMAIDIDEEEKELGIVGMAIDIDEGEKELGIVVMVNDADDETSIPHGVKAI
jgi:hypothetical protein